MQPTRAAGVPPKGEFKMSLRWKRITAALFAVALLAGAIGFAHAVGSGGSAEVRIVAQKLDDGRVEFALEQGAARITPSARFFPADAQVGRWLKSSLVTVDVEVQRLATLPAPRTTHWGKEHTCFNEASESGEIASVRGDWGATHTLTVGDMAYSAGVHSTVDLQDTDWMVQCARYHGLPFTLPHLAN